MDDQLDAFRGGIFAEALDIVIGIGLGEAEDVAIVEPFAVPALVPAFDEDAGEAVLGGEVDIALGLFGGGAVELVARPGAVVDVHRPPDADVLAGLGPGHIADLVGLVEVEDDVGVDEAHSIGRDLDGAPGGVERGLGLDLRPARPVPEVRLEIAGAQLIERHRGIVDQRRLVDRHVLAGHGAEGRGRVRIVNLACGRDAVDIFVAVELVRGGVPHGGLVADGELGELLDDGDVALQRGLFLELVAEADAGVEGAEADGDVARGAVGGGAESDGELVVLVAHQTALAPGLFPRRVDAGAGGAGNGHAALEAVMFGEEHAEQRGCDHLLAVMGDGIGGAAAIVGDSDGDAAVGRGEREAFGGGRGRGPHCCPRDRGHSHEGFPVLRHASSPAPVRRLTWSRCICGSPMRADRASRRLQTARARRSSRRCSCRGGERG